MNKKLSILIIHFRDERILDTLTVLNGTSFRDSIHVHVQDGNSGEVYVERIRAMLLPGDTLDSARDSGIFDGINNSLKHVKAPYFTWIGCDDIIDDSFNLDFVLQLLDDGAKGVQSDVVYFKEDIITRYCKAKSNSYLNYMLGRPLYHFGSTWSSEILRDVKFDLRYRVASDFDFFKIVLKNGYTIERCNNSVVFLGDGGNSSESLSARLEGYKDIYSSYNWKFLFIIFLVRRVYCKLLTKKTSSVKWSLRWLS